VNSGDTSRSSTAFELLNRDTRDLSTWRLITTTAPHQPVSMLAFADGPSVAPVLGGVRFGDVPALLDPDVETQRQHIQVKYRFGAPSLRLT
jgi:hypothetical protein